MRIGKLYDPMSQSRVFRLVSYHDDSLPLFIQIQKSLEHCVCRFAIQVGGRLIGKNDFGLVADSASNRDSLLFAA